MEQPIKNIQLFRNRDISALSGYNETVAAITSLVTNDSQNVFKDGQIVLSRFSDGTSVHTVTGVVCVSGNNKYIDFLAVKDDVDDAISGLTGEAAIANLTNGVLTLYKVTQSNGKISVGSAIATLYVDEAMGSANPLLAESTVDAKIAAERARDYIDSSEYESHSPLKLTEAEITALAQEYEVGHIVYDEATNRFFAWYGNAWGYPTVEVTSNNALAQFDSTSEILILNDEPIKLESDGLKVITYVPSFTQPSDWATNWDKYYLWNSSNNTYYLNTSETYDSTKTYHIKNITTL